MNLLGLDTSTAAASVCVLRDDGRAFEHRPSPAELRARPSHSRTLLPEVARLMADAGLEAGDLGAIAVGVGPGGFTGLRIGIATARGLATAHRLELRPVSSLAALAAGIPSSWPLAVLDARRGEVFAALYEGGEERLAPFAAAPEEAASLARERAAETPLAAGDGAVRWKKAFAAAGVEVAPEGSEIHAVRALNLCRLAMRASPRPPEAVLPHYLREPDATPPSP